MCDVYHVFLICYSNTINLIMTIIILRIKHLCHAMDFAPTRTIIVVVAK